MNKRIITYLMLLFLVSCTADISSVVEEKHFEEDNNISIIIPVDKLYSAKYKINSQSSPYEKYMQVPLTRGGSQRPADIEDLGKNDGKCHIFIVGLAMEQQSDGKFKALYGHPSSFTAKVEIDFAHISGLTKGSVISIDNNGVNVKTSSNGTKLTTGTDLKSGTEDKILGQGSLTFDSAPEHYNNDLCYPIDKTLYFKLMVYISDGGWSKHNIPAELATPASGKKSVDNDELKLVPAQVYVTGDNKIYMGQSKNISYDGKDGGVKRSPVVNFELEPLLSTIEFEFTRSKYFPEDTGISRISVGDFHYLMTLDVEKNSCSFEQSNMTSPTERHCPVKVETLLDEPSNETSPIQIWHPFMFNNDNKTTLALHVANVALEGQQEIKTIIETLVREYSTKIVDEKEYVTNYETSFNTYEIQLKAKEATGKFSTGKNYKVKVTLDAIKDALGKDNIVVKPWVDEIVEFDPNDEGTYTEIK